MKSAIVTHITNRSVFGRKAIAVALYVPIVLYVAIRHLIDAIRTAVDDTRFEMKRVNAFYKNLLAAKTNGEVDDVISRA